MTQIPNCPFGFEDGKVVGYAANAHGLRVEFEFWNEQRGTLVFAGLVGLRDNCAIGVTVGGVVNANASEFIAALAGRLYEQPPGDLRWQHFQFLDLDDHPVLEVVAESCAYHAE